MRKHIDVLFKFIGIVSTICFTLSSIPELVNTIKQGYVGVATGTLYLWFFGELTAILYVLHKDQDKIQLTNYVFNLFIVSILLYFGVIT